MDDPFDRVNQKVLDLFAEMAGERARRLDGSVVATPAMDAISEALTEQWGVEKADKIALHMADWNWDAAFLVALHLYPERFTRDEIEAGIGLFLVHAPHHIRAACQLTGQYVWEDFPEADDTERGTAEDTPELP